MSHPLTVIKVIAGRDGRSIHRNWELYKAGARERNVSLVSKGQLDANHTFSHAGRTWISQTRLSVNCTSRIREGERNICIFPFCRIRYRC